VDNDVVAIRVEGLTTDHWARMGNDDIALIGNLLSHVCKVITVNVDGIVVLKQRMLEPYLTEGCNNSNK
jgi:hypothetical protein